MTKGKRKTDKSGALVRFSIFNALFFQFYVLHFHFFRLGFLFLL